MNENEKFSTRFSDWCKEHSDLIAGVVGLIILIPFYIGFMYVANQCVLSIPLIGWLNDLITKGFFFFYSFVLYLFFTNIKLILVGAVIGIIFFVVAMRKRKKQKARFPVVGLPDDDKVIVLLLLFKIRCSEIAYIYDCISGWRKEAEDDESKSWIKIFIQNLFDCENLRLYLTRDYEEKLKKRNGLKAFNLAKEKFGVYECIKEEDREALRLDVYRYANIGVSTKLKGISSYGFITQTIAELVHEYEIFESRSDRRFFDRKFYNIPFYIKVLRSKENIDQMWKEIILALKASLIYLKVKQANDLKSSNIDIDSILAEIEALASLEYGLRFGIGNSRFKPLESGQNLILDKNTDSVVHDLY